jgi:phosphopantothenoylcysteine decarboxylase/phosphopantothenate--cysteine ligase
VDSIRAMLGRGGDFAGRTVVVTAGGTQEPIDPVRFITNRSSGKMGYAIAEAARDRGARVVLISAPSALRSPGQVTLVPVQRAEEMLAAIREVYGQADALVMVAAVADFRVHQETEHKVKRGDAAVQLTLVPNPDLLQETASLGGRSGLPVRVGFAAETEDLVEHAAEKLTRKALDLIVANDVTAPESGFATDTNQVTLLWANGRHEPLPLLSKTDVANRVLDAVGELLRGRA